MNIISATQTIDKPASEVYSFIKDFRNFEHLMPAQVQDYKASYDECSFEISGMGSVWLEMKERVEDTNVVAASTGNTAINFDLSINLSPQSPGQCTAVAELNAKLSPMLSMIARKPLNNFINMMVEKLKEVLETS
jgi:carbon monoxide dehydrogenase subunit G